MKNKAWFFVLILLCGSVATLSAFARSPDVESYPGAEREISNDEATKDKEDAREAAETCESDCTKEENRTCDTKILLEVDYHKCRNNVGSLCANRCN